MEYIKRCTYVSAYLHWVITKIVFIGTQMYSTKYTYDIVRKNLYFQNVPVSNDFFYLKKKQRNSIWVYFCKIKYLIYMLCWFCMGVWWCTNFTHIQMYKYISKLFEYEASNIFKIFCDEQRDRFILLLPASKQLFCCTSFFFSLILRGSFLWV